MLRRIHGLFAQRRGAISLPQALRERDLLIVDVRTPEEVAAGGSVPGSVNIPVNSIPANTGAFGDDKSRPILFYCKKGIRAADAAEFLKRLGFVNGFSTIDGDAVERILRDVDKQDNVGQKMMECSNMTKTTTTIEDQLAKHNLLIIDSRDSEEVAYNKDFIGAKHIPVSEIANKLDEFGEDKNRPIIVYYGKGSRTSHAERILREHVYTDVVSTTNAAALQHAAQKWRVLHG